MSKMNRIFYDTTFNTGKYKSDVFIDFYMVKKSFTIEGQIMSGYIPFNEVLRSDRICLRYSAYNMAYVDIEVFTKTRFCWFRLNQEEFEEIRHLLLAIN